MIWKDGIFWVTEGILWALIFWYAKMIYQNYRKQKRETKQMLLEMESSMADKITEINEEHKQSCAVLDRIYKATERLLPWAVSNPDAKRTRIAVTEAEYKQIEAHYRNNCGEFYGRIKGYPLIVEATPTAPALKLVSSDKEFMR